MNTTISGKKKVGEPHRIYWQQWIPSSGGNRSSSDTASQEGDTSEASPQEHWSRKELILSSAAIRLSRSAKVKDVTELLRKTLQLPPLTEEDRALHLDPFSPGVDYDLRSFHHEDCLVLVGSIYSLPDDYVQYEHNQQQQQQPIKSAVLPSVQIQEQNRIYPFHIVHTLKSTTKPLDAYDAMDKYLNCFMEHWNKTSLGAGSDRKKSQVVHLAGVSKKSALGDSVTPSSVTQGSIPPVSSTPPAPKIQWYYVPTVSSVNYTGSGTLIPNCVELDGYCTSMEDSDEDSDDEDSASTASTAADSISDGDPWVENYDQLRLHTTFPWLNLKNDTHEGSPSAFTQPIYSKKTKEKIYRQDRLYMELCTSESQTPSHCCLCGYLLYRDRKDPHVWRRMYCVLTNHELWFMSRIYTRVDVASSDAADAIPAMRHSSTFRYVRHGRIRLTRATVIQPTPNEPILHRTPYAFEVISSRGTSHVFRTNNKQMQTLWITTISERIILSYEASLLDNAELIMDEECCARNRRANALAVEPLWDETVRVMQERAQQKVSILAPSIGNSIGSVLRFGIDVALYKDRCRYVLSSMPTRTPMVVATPPRRRFFSRMEEKSSSSSEPVVYEPLDRYIQDMIQVTWDQATALLSRARSLAITLQLRSSIKHDNDESSDVENVRIKLSHGVDTLCRHIEFVLTGRLDHRKEYSSSDLLSTTTNSPGLERLPDPTVGNDSITGSSRNAESPPPADLFDHLLHELQSLAATADRRVIHPPRNPNLVDHQAINETK
jgi:PH domain